MYLSRVKVKGNNRMQLLKNKLLKAFLTAVIS